MGKGRKKKDIKKEEIKQVQNVEETQESRPVTIDIIIPCHNSHATIDRCLGSILCQRVLPSIKVTLVRDGGEHYDDIIERYSPVMNIQEIGYDDNGGPGKARNYGMTHTNGDVIAFIDSDDCYAGPFAIVDLVNELYSEDGIVIVVGDFIEELAPFKFKRHTDDVTFVHGKMYKRSYLEQYKLLFNEEETSNEDVGFNILALMAMRENHKVKYVKKICHYWLNNPNSIVRKDKGVFDHSVSFRTFTKNMMYVFREMGRLGYANTVEVLDERVASMGRVINLFFDKTNGFPEFWDDNLAVVKQFYKEVYQPYEKYITKQMIDEAYNRYPFKKQFQITREEQDKFLKSLGE